MSTKISRKTLWDCAAKGGLILGGATIVCSIISLLIGKLPETKSGVFLGTLLNFIVWAGQLVLCIWIMYSLMKKFSIDFPQSTKKTLRTFGTLVGLTSAFLVAAFSLTYALFIDPETFTEAIDTAIQAYSDMLDSNSMAALDSIRDDLPQITFFSKLIYCFLYGWILSIILSGKLKSGNPFDEDSDPID